MATHTGINGDFELLNNGTISLADNTSLSLVGLNSGFGNDSFWTRGNITGGTGSSFQITTSQLFINKSAGGLGLAGLGTNMAIQGGVNTPSKVTMTNMVNNLALTNAWNYIDVGSHGVLDLNQTIGAAGQQNTVGGISIAGGVTRTEPTAVKVEFGGELDRDGLPAGTGVLNQVVIAGTVWNNGGTVYVASGGDMLNVTGQDGTGNSYLQQNSVAALLKIDRGGNINATGTYAVSSGKVQLTAEDGQSWDELDGAGLVFSGVATSLTIVDSTAGKPSTVTVQGPVTLAATTTTTMNFSGGANKADVLDVHGGTLTLAGKLVLNSSDSNKPTGALKVFDDVGGAAAIAGAFASISDNIGNTYTGAVVPGTGGKDYQVSIGGGGGQE